MNRRDEFVVRWFAISPRTVSAATKDLDSLLESQLAQAKAEIERLRHLETFKAKAIELYPSLAEDWKRIERSSLEHAQKFEDTKEDGA